MTEQYVDRNYQKEYLVQETEDKAACVGRKECHLSSMATEEKAES